MFNEIFNVNTLPTLDLHGEIGQMAVVYINDFINENIKLHNYYIAIVHGKGNGILKSITHDTLKKNKNVIDFKTYYNNDGCTVAKLKNNT